MFEARVENFLDSMKLGSPQVAPVIEALIYGAEPLIHVQDGGSEEACIEQHRDSDGEVKLWIGPQGYFTRISRSFSHA